LGRAVQSVKKKWETGKEVDKKKKRKRKEKADYCASPGQGEKVQKGEKMRARHSVKKKNILQKGEKRLRQNTRRQEQDQRW